MDFNSFARVKLLLKQSLEPHFLS